MARSVVVAAGSRAGKRPALAPVAAKARELAAEAITMVAIGNNARAGEIGGRLLLRLLACLCVVSVWLLLCSDRFEMGWGQGFK